MRLGTFVLKLDPETKDILRRGVVALEGIEKGVVTLMAGFADIQAGITTLGQNISDGITKLGTDLQAEFDAIIKKLTPPDGQVTVAQTDVDAAVTQLTNLSTSTASGFADLASKIEAETASLGSTPVTT